MKDITMDRVNETRNNILEIIKSSSLTHEQKVNSLAGQADSLLEILDLPEGLNELMNTDLDRKCICDLNEGHAPMRPRYIIPDYSILMNKGCEFLDLEAPTDLAEALNTLLIFYKHVPSVTNFPVYVGQLDTLLEPYMDDVTDEEAKKLLKMFFIHLDRTITDSFAHGNLGPAPTRAGSLILEVEKELENAVPNFSLKYEKGLTTDKFALEAIDCALHSAKPSFANHKMFSSEFKGDYVIASCYNGLPLGGGAYTLVRMILSNIAKRSENIEDFKDNQLPYVMDVMARYMDERIKFEVEESGFFENNFLAKEGFIHRDRFSAMFGMVGLAECVNILLEKEGTPGRYGHSENANNLGVEIMDIIDNFNKNHKNTYCEVSNNNFMLHAQVGISDDINISPGTRIPIGEEPKELIDQLKVLNRFHKYFPSGTGDLFPIDVTVHRNPEYVLDIIKGAFDMDLRYMSFYSSDSDVVRVTGYLVKRSEMEKLSCGQAVLQDTTALGLGANLSGHALERKVR